jgi:hypothetical protein
VPLPTLAQQALPQQALLYRLWGPPPTAFGYGIRSGSGLSASNPHGLCTYGITCKAIVDDVLGGDVSRVHSYGARFAGVVFPSSS